jgi:hypothetical protein
MLAAAAAAGATTAAAVMTPVARAFRERHLERFRSRVAAAHGGAPLPQDQYYNNTLDHFDALNTGWWPQRFWVRACRVCMRRNWRGYAPVDP